MSSTTFSMPTDKIFSNVEIVPESGFTILYDGSVRVGNTIFLDIRLQKTSGYFSSSWTKVATIQDYNVNQAIIGIAGINGTDSYGRIEILTNGNIMFMTVKDGDSPRIAYINMVLGNNTSWSDATPVIQNGINFFDVLLGNESETLLGYYSNVPVWSRRIHREALSMAQNTDYVIATIDTGLKIKYIYGIMKLNSSDGDIMQYHTNDAYFPMAYFPNTGQIKARELMASASYTYDIDILLIYSRA